MELTIQSLADLVDGRLRLAAMPPLGGVDEPLGKLVTDPGRVAPGDVLVISDDLRSQHALCETEAFDRGALGIVSAGKPIEPWPGRFSVQVDDASWALWQLASAARGEYEGQVIAVTGKVGKTTTLAMIGSVLGLSPESVPAVASSADGLADQLLGLPHDAAFWLLELHADSACDLDSAVHLCRPHMVVAIHPQRFDENSPADSVASCIELRATLPDGGNLIVGPTPNLLAKALQRHDTVTFGRDGACDVCASHVLCADEELTFAVNGQTARMKTGGRHFLDNSLAAWAVGRTVGLNEQTIAERISRVDLPAKRCKVVRTRGMTFIDDTAGHHPLARRAALALLNSLPGKRRVVVCSNAWSCEEQRTNWGNELVEIGGADTVVVTGANSDAILKSAMDAGMPRGQCIRCEASDSVGQKLFNFLSSGDLVLLTGVDAQLADRVLALFQNTVSATTAKAAAA